MQNHYRLRLAFPEDADLISRQRAWMYVDMNSMGIDDSERLSEAYRPFVRSALESGQYLGWLVEDVDGVVVAGAGVTLRDLAPLPGCYRVGRWASIGNLYTLPDHRRRGIARLLMETILQWCKENAIDQVTLSASEPGRPLYESLGFIPTEDMRFHSFPDGYGSDDPEV